MRQPWVLLALVQISPLQAAEPRFSGNADLSAATTQASADQRFSLAAALHSAPRVASVSGDGRFALVADLAAPKATAGTCGGLDALFGNHWAQYLSAIAPDVSAYVAARGRNGVTPSQSSMK